MPPKVIGPYHVLETLGTGGVATVYRAIDRRSSEQVALKLLSTGPAALDPRAARRLAREFETLARLAHPYVVRVFDTGVHQGYPYLAMELVEGLTLRHYLDVKDDEASDPVGPLLLPPLPRRSRFAEDVPSETESQSEPRAPRTFGLSNLGEEAPSEEVSYQSGPDSVRELADLADEPDTEDFHEYELPYELPIPDEQVLEELPPSDRLLALNRPGRMIRLKEAMLQLCEALAYIHGHGLVHRDLKPSNIMVDDERQVRLMDFGLAKFLADDAAVTANGRMVGTFRYMAPEQILGETLDARADLYSLGITLYEMLAGRPPFDAKTPYELWQKVLETDAAPLLALNVRADPLLVRVAHRLMRKEPDDRYQTAEEVYEALSE